MTNEVEVPEEGVKRARIAERMVFGQTSARDGLREVLAAAAPSIRSQERQRVREILEQMVREHRESGAPDPAVAALEIALDTLDPSKEVRGNG